MQKHADNITKLIVKFNNDEKALGAIQDIYINSLKQANVLDSEILNDLETSMSDKLHKKIKSFSGFGSFDPPPAFLTAVPRAGKILTKPAADQRIKL